jgi:alpha-beta hydrolase superfamily lysophospholipase
MHLKADKLEGWLRARKAQAPVDSAPEDIARFLDVSPRSLHPAVGSARILFSPGRTVKKPLFKGRANRVVRVESRFSYASPVQSPYPENNMVHGLKWHGRGEDSARTALVMVHGAFAPALIAERVLSMPLMERGVHVFALAVPYHMSRAPAESKYSGQYLLSGDIPRLIDGLIQAAADVRVLVRSLKDAGYSSIYLLGTSMGGNIVSQVLSFEEVDGAILLVPAVDFAALVQSAPLAAGIRGSMLDAGFHPEDLTQAMRAVSPAALGRPRVRCENILLYYGTRDLQVPPWTVEEFISAWPGMQVTALPRSHRGMGAALFRLRSRLFRLLAPWESER